MYRKDEKKRIVSIRNELFNYQGNGEYDGKKYPFVLKNAELNLGDNIRKNAIEYFKENKIQWHKGKDDLPNGHLLSYISKRIY